MSPLNSSDHSTPRQGVSGHHQPPHVTITGTPFRRHPLRWKARRQSEHTVDGKRVKVWSTESVPLQLTERCCRRRRRRRKSTGGGSRRCGAQQRRPWIAYPSSSVRKGDSRYTSDGKGDCVQVPEYTKGAFQQKCGHRVAFVVRYLLHSV